MKNNFLIILLLATMVVLSENSCKKKSSGVIVEHEIRFEAYSTDSFARQIFITVNKSTKQGDEIIANNPYDHYFLPFTRTIKIKGIQTVEKYTYSIAARVTPKSNVILKIYIDKHLKIQQTGREEDIAGETYIDF